VYFVKAGCFRYTFKVFKILFHIWSSSYVLQNSILDYNEDLQLDFFQKVKKPASTLLQNLSNCKKSIKILFH
jgi:hypothetical protein